MSCKLNLDILAYDWADMQGQGPGLDCRSRINILDEAGTLSGGGSRT